MKNYNSKKEDQAKHHRIFQSKLAELGIENILSSGSSKIGITRKSHEETKEHRKLAASSRKQNRLCKHNKNRR